MHVFMYVVMSVLLYLEAVRATYRSSLCPEWLETELVVVKKRYGMSLERVRYVVKKEAVVKKVLSVVKANLSPEKGTICYKKGTVYHKEVLYVVQKVLCVVNISLSLSYKKNCML